MGVYIGIGLSSAALVTLFMDCLPRVETQSIKSSKTTDLLIATFHHLKNKKQLALIPVTMHIGLSQAAFNAEFTKVWIYLSRLYKIYEIILFNSFLSLTK